jgi:hypothetical protein
MCTLILLPTLSRFWLVATAISDFPDANGSFDQADYDTVVFAENIYLGGWTKEELCNAIPCGWGGGGKGSLIS